MSEPTPTPDRLTAASDPGAGLRGLLVALGGFVVTGLLVTPAGDRIAARVGGEGGDWALALALPAQAATFGLAALATRRELGFRRPTSPVVLPIALLGLWASDAWMALVKVVFPGLNPADMDGLLESLTGPAGLPVAVGAALFAPLGEELFFRGALWTVVRERAGELAAWSASAALFALWHGDPVHGLAALWGGLWLGWARLRTGSLWPPLGLHLLNNLVWVLGGGGVNAPAWGAAAALGAVGIAGVCELAWARSQRN